MSERERAEDARCYWMLMAALLAFVLLVATFATLIANAPERERGGLLFQHVPESPPETLELEDK